MLWQDAVIAVANITFSIALIPLIVNRGQFRISSSLIIAIGLWAKTGAMVSLGLLFGGITVGVAAMWWTGLFIKRLFEGRSSDK